MNKQEELAKSLAAAAKKFAEQDDFNRTVERISADVQKKLADAAKTDSREITCPHCNEKFTTSWRTDDASSNTGAADPDNTQDGASEHDQSKAAKMKYMARYLAAGKTPQKQN